jgi:hypothetical protein
MIILYKITRQARLSIIPGVETLQEKTPLIIKYVRLYDHYVGQRGFGNRDQEEFLWKSHQAAKTPFRITELGQTCVPGALYRQAIQRSGDRQPIP